MQDYNTIIGVIVMRQNLCSYSVIEARYHIGSGTTQRILKCFEASGMTLAELKAMEPSAVEELIYPPENLQRKDIPMPDFQYYYDRIHAKGSKVNISYCWIEYKQEHPDGYEQTQFYEYYNRFVEKNYGSREAKMAVERIPGEKMYIDWVGEQPELLTDPETGEIRKVHIFATTLGVSSLIYAEAFMNEKLPQFIAGTVHAVQFYGGIAKYFVPDNLKAAIKKHTKDELVLQAAYSDLEDFYDTIVLPPPPRKDSIYVGDDIKDKVSKSLKTINEDTFKRIIEEHRNMWINTPVEDRGAPNHVC